MTFPKSQKSILSLKSLLFTPGNKSDRFARAAGVPADALIIDLEEGSIVREEQARESSIEYLEALSLKDLGAETAWEPLLWVRSRIIQAAAVTKVPVLDSPYFDIADVNGLKRETEASGRLGFHGKCAIHPARLDPD